MKKRGITYKIFCITAALLVVSALIIYFTLYFLLPGYYLDYKKSSLQSGANSLISSLEQSVYEEAGPLLEDFASKYNVPLVIQNGEDNTIFFPINMNRILNEENSILSWKSKEDIQQIEANLRRFGDIYISEQVRFLNDSKEYKVTIFSSIQPIDEATEVILMFLPYMLIIIIIISIIGAYIYSRLISKPLIHLNSIAGKMAQLDFSIESCINSNDELGELSRSLDKLAKNLKERMGELKEANLKLKDDIQKEREQEVKRREFIATISHELKTPMAAVLGQLEGMIYEIGSYKNRDKYLRQSYQIMKEMEKLVHEILDLSRLESFNFTPQIQRVNLSVLVRHMIENFYYLSDVSSIEFIMDIEAGVYIEADEKLISKAIANVISNAVKYSAEQEKVIIDLKSKEQKIQLHILNTGARIDESQLEKVFEPFYRIEKSRNRKTGGSGLGLYIVKRILEMHQIEYSLDNVPEGVMFVMNLKKA